MVQEASKPSGTKETQYLDNALRVLPVTVDLSSSDRDDQLRRVTLTLCPWLRADGGSELLSVKPLSGGLSNELFVVKNHQHQVLVRIQPPSTGSSDIVDREKENRVAAWLSQEGDAPVYLGRFENGRIEEFYVSHTPLSCQEMVERGPAIARIMARLHTKSVPQWFHSSPSSVMELLPEADGEIWGVVDEWLALAKQSSVKSARFQDLLREAESEWTWLKSALLLHVATDSDEETSVDPLQERARQFCQEIVLAHMDMQSLNLLQHKSSLKLIDFEYAGLNPRGVDIANTFCEHCDMNDLCADYDAEYPSVETQNAFLRAYLHAVRPELLEESEEEDFLSHLRAEIGKYTLVSHLSWAIWSLVQQDRSAIDYDYLAYAEHRMEGCCNFRQRFFS